MKTLCFILTCLVFTSHLLAQDNCFEKCQENFKNSPLKFPESSDAVKEALVGCKAPEFNVQSMKGEKLQLSNLKGKVVVLNFWFTSCSPCIAELPALNKLVTEYGDKDVVSLRSQETIETILKLYCQSIHSVII